jgi:hypothetical protein
MTELPEIDAPRAARKGTVRARSRAADSAVMQPARRLRGKLSARLTGAGLA